jgi:hypothetical protein
VPYSAEESEYTVSFTSPIPINTNSACFVKYTFPSEIDVSNLDLDNIETSGYFF